MYTLEPCNRNVCSSLELQDYCNLQCIVNCYKAHADVTCGDFNGMLDCACARTSWLTLNRESQRADMTLEELGNAVGLQGLLGAALRLQGLLRLALCLGQAQEVFIS